MIIRQRNTFLDPFLLKVVFPYFNPNNVRILSWLVGYWNSQVLAENVQRGRDVAGDEPLLGSYVEGWQNALSTALRWLLPQQALMPIAIVIHQADRFQRPFRR
ncbi:MAG: hypothetical protein M0Z94_05605 [Dehalococcoidales bacterium]|nr:hypothetical protein [Dehalococcoidales bacterium]